MNDSLTFLLPALLSGLLGSGHCLAMCGGIVSALGLSTARRPLAIGYHVGRIGTYMVIGAFVGGLTSFLPTMFSPALRVFAALWVIALGLYITGWWRVLVRLETLGKQVWRHIQPHTRKVLPINSWPRAIAAGALWGWLPCGLVYSVLGLASSSQSITLGAGVMLLFGVGTLPSMLGAMMFAQRLQRIMQHPGGKTLAGLLLLALGLWMLWPFIAPMPGHLHAFDPHALMALLWHNSASVLT
ncbi:sulfite exporter TauE/SafE family protein [Salinispirillum marinum]|uniref:Sulfite exporter TauE/SafE family protein n=2 Tax=Saccharospirillaceae TaxID=255527 RepID=A0ABV8B9A4_9GAMM